jgi:predicted ArsR family transcriptional regulator
MKSLTSQETVLSVLAAAGSLTTNEISVECGIDEPSVRYHLRHLRSLGLVQVLANQIGSEKAGRKALRYRLVRSDFHGSIDTLCHALLANFQQKQVIDRHSDPASLLAELFIGENQFDPGFYSSKSLLMRKIVDWLNQHHYAAFWEAGKVGPVIQFKNCPFRDIRDRNDILCDLDARLLQGLSGQDWQQEDRVDWQNLTGCCRFIVKPASNR